MTLNPEQFDGFEYRGIRVSNIRSGMHGKQTKNVTGRMIPILFDYQSGETKEGNHMSASQEKAKRFLDNALHEKFGGRAEEGKLRMNRVNYRAMGEQAEHKSAEELSSPEDYARRHKEWVAQGGFDFGLE